MHDRMVVTALVWMPVWILVGITTGWPRWWRIGVGVPLATLSLWVWFSLHVLPGWSVISALLFASFIAWAVVDRFVPRLATVLALASVLAWAWLAAMGHAIHAPWWMAIFSGWAVGWVARPANHQESPLVAPYTPLQLALVVGPTVLAVGLYVALMSHENVDHVRRFPLKNLWFESLTLLVPIILLDAGFRHQPQDHIGQILVLSMRRARGWLCALGCGSCFVWMISAHNPGVDEASLPPWTDVLRTWAIASTICVIGDWWLAWHAQPGAVSSRCWIAAVAILAGMTLIGHRASVPFAGWFMLGLAASGLLIALRGRARAAWTWIACSAGRCSMIFGLCGFMAVASNPAGFSYGSMISWIIMPVFWCAAICRGLHLVLRHGNPDNDDRLPLHAVVPASTRVRRIGPVP